MSTATRWSRSERQCRWQTVVRNRFSIMIVMVIWLIIACDLTDRMKVGAMIIGARDFVIPMVVVAATAQIGHFMDTTDSPITAQTQR